MKAKKILAFFLALLLVFSLSGCEYLNKAIEFLTDTETEEPTEPFPEEPEEPEPVVDPNWPVIIGDLTVEKAPETVAVASPALAEYLYDMGLLDKASALCEGCAFGDAAKNYPSVGSVLLPDLAVIEEMQPEYILTLAPYEESVLIKLQQMDITVISFAAPRSFDELEALYRELALFFLGAEDGKTFGEDYVTGYEAAKAAVHYDGEKSEIACLRGMDRLILTGEGIAGELLFACFENVAGSYTGYEYPEDDWKKFDPDAIFVGGELRIKDLETSDLYKKKSAVKGDKVFLADLDALSLGSLRSFAILKDMMATVYADYTEGTALSPAYPSIYQ